MGPETVKRGARKKSHSAANAASMVKENGSLRPEKGERAAHAGLSTPGLGEMTRTFLRIGFLSFGGPAGQIALMHRVLVEEKRWVDEAQYLHALNFCMLLPGPEAQQLATYCGWLLHGKRGGLIAGALFVLPGLVVILALSALYASFADTHVIDTVFFGMKAAVLAIVIEALIRVGKRALVSRFHKGVALSSFLALFLLNLPFPLVIATAGNAGYAAVYRGFIDKPKLQKLPALRGRRPKRPKWTATLKTVTLWGLIWMLPLPVVWFLPTSVDLIAEVMTGAPNVFATLFLFFSKMALFTFGGAYAVLSYVGQEASSHFAWLSAGEMLDGLALAETTPGPLVLVLSYVGFLAGYRNPAGYPALAAGLAGGVLAAWATFLPSFLFIFAGAPYIERLRTNRNLAGALSAVTAAVTGVILNLSVWFALNVLFSSTHRVMLIGLPVKTVAGDTNVPLVSLPMPDFSTFNPLAAFLALLSAFLVFRLKAGMLVTLLTVAGLGAVLQTGFHHLGWI